MGNEQTHIVHAHEIVIKDWKLIIKRFHAKFDVKLFHFQSISIIDVIISGLSWRLFPLPSANCQQYKIQCCVIWENFADNFNIYIFGDDSAKRHCGSPKYRMPWKLLKTFFTFEQSFGVCIFGRDCLRGCRSRALHDTSSLEIELLLEWLDSICCYCNQQCLKSSDLLGIMNNKKVMQTFFW